MKRQVEEQAADSLGCWQINLQHSVAATSHLVSELGCSESSNHKIVFVQEPYFNAKGKCVGFSSALKTLYASVQKPRAMIVTKNMDCCFCPNFSGKDVATAVWNGGDRGQVFVSSAYFDIKEDQPPTELIKLLEAKASEGLIIGADSNAHSPLWGSKDLNARGIWVEHLIAKYNLIILNEGSSPTFKTIRAESRIDITLCTAKIFEYVSGWEVDPQYQFSDHRRINFALRVKIPRPSLTWDVKSANWDKFTDSVEKASAAWRKQARAAWSKEMLDKEAIKLKKDINVSLLRSTKWRVKQGNKFKLNWWNDELETLKAEVRRLERLASKDAASREAFSQKRREYKKEIKRSKKLSWREFTSNTDKLHDVAKLSKIIFNNKTPDIGLLKKVDGTFTDDFRETADLLLKNFFPGCKEVTRERVSRNSKRSALIGKSIFTRKKVEEAIKSFGSLKAEGPDGFRPIVLKHFGGQTIKRLCQIFRASISLGHVPEIWTWSKVVFIPKVGKSDYTDPRAFRPISLTTFLFKTMERVVQWYLEENVLPNNPLHKNQHAFSRGKGTDTALAALVDRLESAILRNEHALAVFFDIEGAFDNVRPEMVEIAMKQHNFPDPIVRWYSHYINNRKVKLNLFGQEHCRVLTRGVPQGGVLSPLAWNLNFDNLLKVLNWGPTFGLGFADDGMFVVRGKDPYTLVNIAQQTVDKALSWGDKNGLTFSAKKTAVVMFSRKKWTTKARIKINGQELPFQDSTRYLGVLVDSKLNWKEHISNKIKKSKQKLMHLRNALGVLWGPKPHLFLWVYKCVVIPSLVYGALVWGRANLKNFQTQLVRLNRLALTGIAQMRDKTPTAGLEIITFTCPLDLMILREGLRAFFRWKEVLEWCWDGVGTRGRGIQKLWQTLASEADLDMCPEDVCNELNWKRPFSWGASSGQRDLASESFRMSVTQEGFVIEEDDKCVVAEKVIFPEYCSGEQIMCHKIVRGLEQVEAKAKSRRGIIYLHKQLPASVAHYRIVSGSVLNCLAALKEWTRKFGFEVVFDKLTPSRKKPTWKSEVNVRPAPPKGNFRKASEDWMVQKWTRRWHESQECRQTKAWLPRADKFLSVKITQMDRYWLGIFIQFITGHCWLNRHSFILNEKEDPMCRLCLEEEETPLHLVMECPAITKEVTEIFGDVRTTGLCSESSKTHWDPVQVSTFLHVEQIAGLLGLEG